MKPSASATAMRYQSRLQNPSAVTSHRRHSTCGWIGCRSYSSRCYCAMRTMLETAALSWQCDRLRWSQFSLHRPIAGQARCTGKVARLPGSKVSSLQAAPQASARNIIRFDRARLKDAPPHKQFAPAVKRLESGGFMIRPRNASNERQVQVQLNSRGPSFPQRRVVSPIRCYVGFTVPEMIDLNRKAQFLRGGMTAGGLAALRRPAIAAMNQLAPMAPCQLLNTRKSRKKCRKWGTEPQKHG